MNDQICMDTFLMNASRPLFNFLSVKIALFVKIYKTIEIKWLTFKIKSDWTLLVINVIKICCNLMMQNKLNYIQMLSGQ